MVAITLVPLITETVLAPELATKTWPFAASTVIASGVAPTVMFFSGINEVGGGGLVARYAAEVALGAIAPATPEKRRTTTVSAARTPTGAPNRATSNLFSPPTLSGAAKACGSKGFGYTPSEGGG